jgi:hypothetical protein
MHEWREREIVSFVDSRHYRAPFATRLVRRARIPRLPTEGGFMRCGARPGSRSVLRSALLVLAVLAPVTARAQAVVDPTTAEFNPSADHDALNDGVPIVSRYELGFYQIGATEPFQVMSLGKPDPDPDGKLRVVFTGLMGTVPTPEINYEARISAAGPGGVGTSDPSNAFSFSAPPPCVYVVVPLIQTVAASAGNGSVSLTTTVPCSWTATSNASFITIASGGSGSGNGTVNFTVTANPTTSQRSGTLTVADRTITVNQAGMCAFTLSATSQPMPAAGGTSDVTVTTNPGCGWGATSNATWIAITGSLPGSGPGALNFSVSANTTPAARMGTLTVAGQTLTLTQPSANPAPSAPTGLQIR